MKYQIKRGRPKLNRPIKDAGTPELAAKRKAGLTAEPLDICLQRGMVSQDEHWAGVHFRWLYTVVFGVPNPSASDPGALRGKALRCDNPLWLRDRELEYARAKTVLLRLKAVPVVPDVCVFSKYPVFLRGGGKDEYTRFKEGLEGLAGVFRRGVDG